MEIKNAENKLNGLKFIMKRIWEEDSDQDLLSRPLRSLGLSLETPFIADGVRQLYFELHKKNLVFRPHFWISEEWFCPDGIPGIAVPFYLLHPRLLNFEKKFIGYAEGEQFPDLLKLLRHETGHAVDNAYGLRKNALRLEIFGSSEKPYPRSYLPQAHSRRFVRHLRDFYSQSHPDEDFAETFAVWLTPNFEWRKKSYGRSIRKKLEAIDHIMSSLQGRSPLNQFRGTYEPLHRSRLTLRQYLYKKRRRLGVAPPSDMDAKLMAVFRNKLTYSPKGQGQKAGEFFKIHRNYLRDKISLGLGEPKYRIDHVIRRMSQRADELGLQIGHNRKLGPLLDIVTAQSLDDLLRNRHHIIL